MDDFLALTLAGRWPHHFHGETAHFRWHWIDCGILLLTRMRAANVHWYSPAVFTAMKPRRWR